MHLTKDKVAVINYKLTNDDGQIIDQSLDGEFSYLHGANNIIPGLEKELEAKKPGDRLNIIIEPVDAYGERDQEKIQQIPRELFPPGIDLKPGMSFRGKTDQEQSVIVTITRIEDEHVIVDANHPLAGMRLHFDVEVVAVREATDEEISQGHVYGEGQIH